MISISEREFGRLAGFVRLHSGIRLVPGKEYLLETRLQPLLREQGFSSFSDLCERLAFSEAGILRDKVISAVTTSETLFFRDKAWFDLLRFKIFPDLMDFRGRASSSGEGTFTVWSAGCSTGQEVYSVIMAFMETMRRRPGVGIRVLGSDISDEAVSRASYGEYSEFEMGRGLDSGLRDRYFHKVGSMWRVRDEVRSRASFSRVNLLADPVLPGPFDVVLCRNVGIYFSSADRTRLFQRMHSALRSPGFLLLGASESLGDDAGRDMVRQRHLNALYYMREPSESLAGRLVGNGEQALPVLSRPVAVKNDVKGAGRVRISAGGGFRKLMPGKSGDETVLPRKEPPFPREIAAEPTEKKGVLAALHRPGSNSLLGKMHPGSGPGVLAVLRENAKSDD